MSTNPYDLLSLPQRFDVDDRLLHQRFIEACSVHHPDRFTDPIAQADAVERSAEINAAYQTLSDPEQRADCLLALLGGATKEQDKSLPDDLLLDMMQTRERMEQAVAEQDQDVLDELAHWARQQRGDHLVRIAEYFGQVDTASSDQRAEHLKAIRLELNALRYIERMIEQMPL